MKDFIRITAHLSTILAAMLLFLFLFQNKIVLPPVLQSVGRMHPLLLHLPIGTFMLSSLFWLFRKQLDAISFQSIFAFTLTISAFTAVLTALMGMFLSKEEGYGGDTLYWHRTLSVIFAIGSYILMLWCQSTDVPKTGLPVFLFSLLFLLIAASHQGARLTHGDRFILQPVQKDSTAASSPITDSSSLFQAALMPLFQSKCVTCHNPQKAKGDLDLTSEAGMAKGGKHGPVWIAGDAQSQILLNIDLPLDDKKHMPPTGKPQLTYEEKNLIRQWILSGADLKKQIRAYDPTDTLMLLAAPFIQRTEITIKKYNFPAADATLIQKMNDPYCAVFPLDQNTPALQADFFVREKYNPTKLTELLKIKDQLVVLNMDNMPATDDDIASLGKFINLEKLILNHSSITNKSALVLSTLPALTSLAIAGTAVDATILAQLQKSPLLREVFLWNTKVTPEDLKSLDPKVNKIRFNLGYRPDSTEILPLTSPTKINESEILTLHDSVGLKHQIRGVVIRYTTDGSVPDSATGPVYSSPIAINKGYTLIKARAVKEGWLSSPVIEWPFFKQGIIAQKAELLSTPDEKYKAKGGLTLIDGKKGPASNFKDEAWIGFREQPFSALFQVDTFQPVYNITMSINKSVSSYILLPAEVLIYAGHSPSTLKLLKKVNPPALTKKELGTVKNDVVHIDLGGVKYLYYKINAKPLPRLPSWHPGKGERGWVFIDEVFFN